MRYGSLFTGVGGFDLALDQAGMDCAFQCEIDAKASKVLARHWPNVPRFTDITELSYAALAALAALAASSAAPVDLLCGGFPCQDLSVAGKRAGLDGARSGLFFEFARVIDEVAPEWVILENVPGLLSSNSGRDMGTVLGTLGDLGYGFAYRVLDARFFGVPQRRRRVFIVGRLGDWRGPAEVLLEPESRRGDLAASGEAGEGSAADAAGSTGARRQVAALTSSGVGTCGADDNQAQAGHLLPTPRSHPRPGSADPGAVVLGFSHTQGLDEQVSDEAWPTLRGGGGGQAVALASMTGRGWWNADEDFTATLAAREAKDTAHVAVAASFHPGAVQRAGDVPRVEGGRPANTLHAQGLSVIDQDLAVRRLTPRECERLQGFPDDFTRGIKFPQADSARYRQMGNAVAVPVVRWIGERIVAVDASADMAVAA